MEQIVTRLSLTSDQIASLDRMVQASGVGSRTAFVQAVVRSIIADEMADHSRCVTENSTVASKCA